MAEVREERRVSTAELNVRILHSLSTCLKVEQGQETLERVAAAANLRAADFDGTRWISLAQCEAFLAAARRLFPSDEAFCKAFAFDFQRASASYGPMLVLLRAATPWAGYVFGCRNMHLLTRISRFETERSGGHCTVRYSSSRQESYLMCLSRLGQLMVVPTLWGQPPVTIQHPRCIARGDECCEYAFDLPEAVRWLPAAAGLLLGCVVLASLRFAIGPSLFVTAWPFLLPLVSLVLGSAVEWRRASRANLALAVDIRDAATELADAEAEARREILAFQQRQRDWTSLLEEHVAERMATQQKVIEEIRDLERRRVQTMRAFSHDLRSPLTIVTAHSAYLREGGDPDSAELADELESASREMSRLIASLMRTLSAEDALLKLTPRELPVPPLVEKIRRRLSAICYHREIRTSTFSTREAPESLEVDEILLDRVIDNLITNAAKYTKQGSILVEVGGTPGFLTIKVSDTGRGIEEALIERIFQPGGSDAASRARDSYGLGLSVVVQLLAQAGGKLEVMSKPGVGTTFWAHFPLRPPPAPTGEAPPQDDLVRKVVVIRRAHA